MFTFRVVYTLGMYIRAYMAVQANSAAPEHKKYVHGETIVIFTAPEVDQDQRKLKILTVPRG